MLIYNGLSEFSKNENSIVTIGTFDGLHLGHQKIVDQLVNSAKSLNAKSTVISFDPHPRQIVSGDYSLSILTTIPEKSEILKNSGVDGLVILEFNKALSQMSAEDFITDVILDKIGLRGIIIGYDHRFGKGRDGGEEMLSKLSETHGFFIKKVDAVSVNGTEVSSTKIRDFLLKGNVFEAREFLGRYYSFEGVVVKGDQRGRKLGFPTANLMLTGYKKLLPAIGSYAVYVDLEGQRYKAMMNIGRRPTFNRWDLAVEVNIFDFDKMIYGDKLTVFVVERLREEIKFLSVLDLVEQLNKDREKALKYL